MVKQVDNITILALSCSLHSAGRSVHCTVHSEGSSDKKTMAARFP